MSTATDYGIDYFEEFESILPDVEPTNTVTYYSKAPGNLTIKYVDEIKNVQNLNYKITVAGTIDKNYLSKLNMNYTFKYNNSKENASIKASGYIKTNCKINECSPEYPDLSNFNEKVIR